MRNRSQPVAAAPILKWAGGKRRLLGQYEKHFPTEFGSYFEPFVGGGAVFFWLRERGLLQGKRVVLNDINPELVNFYQVLRDQCDELIKELEIHAKKHDSDYYYEVRARDRNSLHPVAQAARLLYLNRTCFNGLYRVNSKGEFNVPVGRYKAPRICDPERLQKASEALHQAEIRLGGFGQVADEAQPGDLVYFDPPYVPLNTTSSFTAYTRENFRPEEQAELARTFRELSQRKVKVLLSNSDTPEVQSLYAQFQQVPILAPRAINSKGDRRQKVTELLVLS